jgi:hypothetical protein
MGWSGWATTLSLVAIGAVALGVETADGDLAAGLVWFGILGGLGALLAVGGRFESVRVARGDGGDERDTLIERTAMAVTGTVLVIALTAALVVELVRDGDPSRYFPILAVGGVTYAAAWTWLRWRS